MPCTLYLSLEEHRSWQAAWRSGLEAPATSPTGWALLGEPWPSALLLDRLAVLLAGLASVEHADLCRARRKHAAWDGRLALLVQCPDASVTDRLRRALPLLGWGLPPHEAPSLLLSKLDTGHAEPDIDAPLTPVYDRALGAWLRHNGC